MDKNSLQTQAASEQTDQDQEQQEGDGVNVGGDDHQDQPAVQGHWEVTDPPAKCNEDETAIIQNIGENLREAAGALWENADKLNRLGNSVQATMIDQATGMMAVAQKLNKAADACEKYEKSLE